MFIYYTFSKKDVNSATTISCYNLGMALTIQQVRAEWVVAEGLRGSAFNT